MSALNIAKQLVYGALRGLSAYIKPGGVHRLAPLSAFDEITCNIVSSIDFLVENIEVGSRVKRGDLNIANVDFNKLFSSPLKECFRNCKEVYPEYLIPLMVLGFAIGLSDVESTLEQTSKFKKALETVNSVSKWNEIKQIIEAFRLVGRTDMYEHLQSTGYTQIALLRSGVTLNEIFRVLSSKWRGFILIDSRESYLFQYLKRLKELRDEYKNFNNALIALYMELIDQYIPQNLRDKAKNAQQCRYMSTPECAKILYVLDLQLRKNNINFNWASEIIVLTSAMASFEGLT